MGLIASHNLNNAQYNGIHHSNSKGKDNNNIQFVRLNGNAEYKNTQYKATQY